MQTVTVPGCIRSCRRISHWATATHGEKCCTLISWQIQALPAAGMSWGSARVTQDPVPCTQDPADLSDGCHALEHYQTGHFTQMLFKHPPIVFLFSSFFLGLIGLFVYLREVLTVRPGRPQICDPPASGCQVLGLNMCGPCLASWPYSSGLLTQTPISLDFPYSMM